MSQKKEEEFQWLETGWQLTRSGNFKWLHLYIIMVVAKILLIELPLSKFHCIKEGRHIYSQLQKLG